MFQPSSGAAERVFAMLKWWMFGDSQASLLADYKEGSMMMRYNDAGRKKVQENY